MQAYRRPKTHQKGARYWQVTPGLFWTPTDIRSASFLYRFIGNSNVEYRVAPFCDVAGWTNALLRKCNNNALAAIPTGDVLRRLLDALHGRSNGAPDIGSSIFSAMLRQPAACSCKNRPSITPPNATNRLDFAKARWLFLQRFKAWLVQTLPASICQSPAFVALKSSTT